VTAPVEKTLRILYLEDDLGSFELVRALLAAEQLDASVEHVEDEAGFRRALAGSPPDLVLSDYNLPTIDGLSALALQRELRPEVPFIFLSGALGEETAIDLLRQGATDFVLKDSISRLVPAIRRAIAAAREHADRLRAERSLRESEARFRRLAQNAPDVIFRFRLKPEPIGYEFVSPAIEKVTGYPADEFYANPKLAGMLAHPEDQAMIRAISDSGEVPTGAREVRWIRRDGSIAVTEQRFVPIRDESGQLVAIEGIARDITERKRAEERLRILSAAIEQSPVAVEITDRDNNILFANARLTEMSGYVPGEVLGRNPRLFASGRTPRETHIELWSALNAGRTWRGEFINRRKDGTLYFVRATISPIRDGQGRTEYFLAVKEDITAWKEEQERRRRLEAQLFQAQKLETIGTLAGGIAHDFNNILTGILGFAELAAASLPQGVQARDDLAEVRAGALRAKDLVAQILTFSRQKDSVKVPVDLARLVGEALKFLRASSPATIEFVRDLRPGWVRADPTHIHQVILNLGTNALHAMRSGPGCLTVELDRSVIEAATPCDVGELQPGAYMCLSVRDTGHGIDAPTRQRIFDPFFTTKATGEGTGLGLALVQGIVADHGGAIRLESRVGEGTLFQVYLPECPAEATAAVLGEPAPRGDGQQILVIDDEPPVASFLGSRLQQLGYAVTVFTDPRQGLAHLMDDGRRIDAIITDLTMPHLTGLDLLRRARAQGRRVPAIITSGNPSVIAQGELEALGNVTVAAKPFTGDDLARKLHRMLGDPKPTAG
jgi:PAS domain S-box-containing protein